MVEQERAPHTPERWSERRTGTFNLENLNPEEVARLGEALVYGSNDRIRNRSEGQYDPMNPDFLFVCDFEEYLGRDSDGAESAYLALREADTDEALEMAARLSSAIARSNPQLAANTILKIVGHQEHRIREAKEAAISAHEAVVEALEVSSPEQAAAFERAYEDAWQNQP
ncbi:hypothetical protein [Nocardiopsis lambiniae]|uniref:Uncharacterized protein n=1 Tax=Nocardiopsis lambiniae TaxID=3075539 RepID=A0ABU2MDY2_9ACTN|nr:hypothetical protein [Nocardiopsis sp. DSM 44743]MDT0330886.1 hypothetical protein [Nocardiopsis sp. DSM 44743]